MGKLNWGMAGCGTIGSEMAKALKESGSALYGVTCRTKEKREAFAARYGIPHAYGAGGGKTCAVRKGCLY